MNDNTWLLYKLPLLQNRGHCAPCLLHLSGSEWLKLVFGSKPLPELCKKGLVWRGCWGVGEGGAEQGRLDWPVAEDWVMAQAEGLSCPQGGFWEPECGHTFRSSTGCCFFSVPVAMGVTQEHQPWSKGTSGLWCCKLPLLLSEVQQRAKRQIGSVGCYSAWLNAAVNQHNLQQKLQPPCSVFQDTAVSQRV